MNEDKIRNQFMIAQIISAIICFIFMFYIIFISIDAHMIDDPHNKVIPNIIFLVIIFPYILIFTSNILLAIMIKNVYGNKTIFVFDGAFISELLFIIMFFVLFILRIDRDVATLDKFIFEILESTTLIFWLVTSVRITNKTRSKYITMVDKEKSNHFLSATVKSLVLSLVTIMFTVYMVVYFSMMEIYDTSIIIDTILITVSFTIFILLVGVDIYLIVMYNKDWERQKHNLIKISWINVISVSVLVALELIIVIVWSSVNLKASELILGLVLLQIIWIVYVVPYRMYQITKRTVNKDDKNNTVLKDPTNELKLNLEKITKG